jgi:hypothetical protein
MQAVGGRRGEMPLARTAFKAGAQAVKASVWPPSIARRERKVGVA